MKSWIDWRATALALVLAVAAALPFMTTSVVRRDYYLFNITLTSTSPGTTQLFWDLGRGYGENDSSRQPLKIEPKPVVYRYMMPMGDIQALRFDPIDGVGTFTLSHAEIVNYRGKVVRSFSPADFKAFNQIARLEVHGDTVLVQTTPDARDPILTLTLHTPLHLPSNPYIWFKLGLPVAVPVFLLGLLLGIPAVATRLTHLVAPLGTWLRDRPRTAIALTAVVAVAVQCHPVLFQGRSFASPNNGGLMLYGGLPTLPGSDEYMFTNTMSSDTGALLFQHLYYPMAQREALLGHGELPLWNRWSLAGEPLLGQGQSMFGDPFNFLTIFADGAAWAWDLRFLIAHWLLAAGLGGIVWLLTRHLVPSLVVTIAGAFVAFFTFRLVHPANFSVCYSPCILWAWAGLLAADTRRREAGWLLALVTGNWLVMTSGTMKEAYMLIACLNFAGVLLLFLRPETAGRRARLLTLATVAGIGFALLAAPGWMAFLVAWKHSVTGYDSPGAVTLPLAQFVGFFDDMFYRQTVVDEIIVAPALNFVFLLGALWWVVSPRLWRRDRTGLALLLAAVPPLAFAFGLVPVAVVKRIPFVGNIIHTGNTFSCVLMIVVAVLAGCGLRDALERRRETGWGRHLAWVFAGLAALLAVYFAATRGGAKSPFFTGYATALVLAAAALPLALRWAARTSRPGVLWVALVLGGPLLLWRHCQFGDTFFNAYAFVPGLRTDLHGASAGAQFLDAQRKEPGRVVGWGNTLFPSYNTALHWESLYGVDAVRNPFYQELAIEFGMRRVWVWDWFTKAEEAPDLLPGHDLMNVTHYVADHADPAQTFAGVKLLKQLDLDVYASPTAWPRAFFTDRLGSYATPKEFAAQVRAGDRRPFAATQVGQTDAPKLPADLASRTVRAATGYRLTSNNTSFVIDAPAPGIAVLTEAYYVEDFQVTVDGKPARYFRVNHSFKGVAIESPGRHEITFAYWPQHFTLALWLGAAGFLLLLSGFVWLWRSAPVTNSGQAPA
ncbi:hypothetical protein [Opitutus sp. GAS368]|uniref:hypothetical protein n=1 Tax=Opitutus sp. GAS368 TaxID=1882749 RepID=UPI00087AEAB8|nr:hypothetical protein [Opitutus sp. GAS368]SDS25025.1 hypothetical protein SAMN05444173_2325 [Opitutus sp. GAS368]